MLNFNDNRREKDQPFFKVKRFSSMRNALIISLLLVFGHASQGAERSNYARADSIYDELSPVERYNLKVWLDVRSGPAPSSITSDIGGVYIEDMSMLGTLELTPYQSVALQLDENFNSIFEQTEEVDLYPSLNTLSSVDNHELIIDYLRVFRKKARERGVHFVVLPEVGQQAYLSGILHSIHQFDPQFFLLNEDLSFDPESRRKHFYPQLTAKAAIVLSPGKLSEYDRTLRKGPKNRPFTEAEVRTHLRNIIEQNKTSTENFSQKTLHQIWSQSVSLYEKERAVLPLRSDTIAVWVSDENSSLLRELKQYYSTVLNLKYDRIPVGVPVIIDSRFNLFQAREYAYAMQADHPVVWIGVPETTINVNAAAHVVTPQIHKFHNEILADMIYGGQAILGVARIPMPAFIASYQPRKTREQKLLSYGRAEWTGMNPAYLDSIDYVVDEMIQQHAAPGCQVLVARSGKIVFNKAYGYLTYDSLIEVLPQTMYDLASLTKVTATLLAVMDLEQTGRIHLDSAVSTYVPLFRGTNKDSVTLRQVLAHNAGLPAYIPFWKRSLSIEGLETFYYRSREARDADKRSYGMDPNPELRDSLHSWIKSSHVRKDAGYRYSDIGFMIMQNIVEEVTGLSLDQYVTQNFYEPLSLRRTVFNPASHRVENYLIAPTEYDYYFRDAQVWGEVHDRNAAILGGVAGHAGLFSNAKELAVMLQMILQDGEYGGIQFFEPETLNKFNSYYFPDNRRGLGWDKPGEYNPSVSAYVSPDSFGHTGFTGTLVWVDPAYDIVYIFLSNRIFPDSRNWRINKLETRRRIHDLIYKSLNAY